jgi:tetratricopeptide (TPR) repeat protein
LAAEFPRGDAVIQLAALAHYSLQNFEEAQELFEELLRRDPHRIEVGLGGCCAVLWCTVLGAVLWCAVLCCGAIGSKWVKWEVRGLGSC